MALLVRISSVRRSLTRFGSSPSLSLHNKIAKFSFMMTLCSGSASPAARKPLVAQADNDTSTMVISYRECCIDWSRGKKLEFKHVKQPSGNFCSFMESKPKEEIVTFFREIAKELECKRQIWDFHMKILDGDGDFRVEIYHGAEKLGPVVVPLMDCISCHANAILYSGEEPRIEAGECVLGEFSDQLLAVCRLDAKARCGFIITPVRHVGRMSDLNDEELFGLWSLAVRALRHANLPFTSMILNHGTYRNLEHLHLKVWVDKDLHDQYRSCWSKERQELWKQLQDLALKRHRKRALLKKR